jgi:hypothetical protein
VIPDRERLVLREDEEEGRSSVPKSVARYLAARHGVAHVRARITVRVVPGAEGGRVIAEISLPDFREDQTPDPGAKSVGPDHEIEPAARGALEAHRDALRVLVERRDAVADDRLDPVGYQLVQTGGEVAAQQA